MLGVGGNNQTKPILAHIYPLIYINLHVKYGKYLIRTFRVKIQNMKIYFYFFGGPGGGGGGGGGYIKFRVPGHQNVSKCIFHHSGDIYIHFFLNVYFWLFEGPWEGPSVIRLSVSCSPGILSPISLCM